MAITQGTQEWLTGTITEFLLSHPPTPWSIPPVPLIHQQFRPQLLRHDSSPSAWLMFHPSEAIVPIRKEGREGVGVTPGSFIPDCPAGFH